MLTAVLQAALQDCMTITAWCWCLMSLVRSSARHFILRAGASSGQLCPGSSSRRETLVKVWREHSGPVAQWLAGLS